MPEIETQTNKKDRASIIKKKPDYSHTEYAKRAKRTYYLTHKEEFKIRNKNYREYKKIEKFIFS